MTDLDALILLLISIPIGFYSIAIYKILIGFFTPRPYWLFKEGKAGLKPKQK